MLFLCYIYSLCDKSRSQKTEELYFYKEFLSSLKFLPIVVS